MDAIDRETIPDTGMRGAVATRPAQLVAALAGSVYLAFMAVHVGVAADGGALLLRRWPDLGPWLGTAGWAVYTAAALLAVPLVGVRATGIRTRPAPGWARMAIPIVAASLPFALLGWNLDGASFIPLLVVGVPLVALNEELFYRGVLLPLLLPLGLRTAVLWSALAFGAGHLVNVVSGAYPPFVAMQVAATTAGGVALAALRIRTGSVWPALIAHVLIDWVAVSTLTGSATSSAFLLPVLFAWLGANLLLWRYGWRLLADRADTASAAAPT
ncbi:MAG: CPBP family intramembrane glutamic endopeptidase [Chloroflexota bacterium]